MIYVLCVWEGVLLIQIKSTRSGGFNRGEKRGYNIGINDSEEEFFFEELIVSTKCD